MASQSENIAKLRDDARAKCFQLGEALKANDLGLVGEHGLSLTRMLFRLEALIEAAGGVEAVTGKRKPTKRERELAELQARILRDESRRNERLARGKTSQPAGRRSKSSPGC